MIVSFLPEPPQPEDRLRRSIKRLLGRLGLDDSPQSMLWIKDEILGMRTMGEITGKVMATIALAYMQTFPYEGQGAEGAFMCQRAKEIREFIDGDLRRVFSDAAVSGEQDNVGE